MSTNGSDLDILINKNQLNEFHNILSETLKDNGGSIVTFIDSRICPRYCVLWNNTDHGGLMIDLHFNAISYRNHIIITNKAIKSNTVSHNGINVLNKRTDKLITLLKELLNNRTCSEKHYNGFIEESLNKEFLDSIFIPLGKPRTAEALMECRIGKYCGSELDRIMRQLDRDFPMKRNSSLLKISKIKRLLHQPGYTIAFLGTDGSGKSTIINHLSPVLNQTFHNAVHYMHLRPGYLPPLSQFNGGKKQNGPVINPHASQPSGFINSLLRWSYYMIDYFFGYYVNIFPKKSIRACTFIFDRYYYDYYIDKRRSRINLPDWIIRLGEIVIPEPDIIICLGTEAETIYKRKPELTLPEIERQVTALRKFCSNHKRAVWIDTGKSIEESSNEAINVIARMMTKRFQFVKLS